MINDRDMLICDCCSRQILVHKCSDSVTVGPKHLTATLGINLHACVECKDDEQQEFEAQVRRDFGEHALDEL